MVRMGKCYFYDECEFPKTDDEGRSTLHAQVMCEQGPQDDGTDSCPYFVRLREGRVKEIMRDGGGQEGVLQFLRDLGGGE